MVGISGKSLTMMFLMKSIVLDFDFMNMNLGFLLFSCRNTHALSDAHRRISRSNKFETYCKVVSNIWLRKRSWKQHPYIWTTVEGRFHID